MTNRISRLAPSPTGALHLGNARTFLMNWAIARNNGWQLLMRMEDLDGPRIRASAAQEAIDILSWLGIDWDGETMYQSTDLSAYRAAMIELCTRKLAYRADLTRAQVAQAAGAPHAEDHEVAFPASLRSTVAADYEFDGELVNYRFVVPDDPVTVDDEVHGRLRINPAADIGDFVIWTRRGTPAYQLAVVVDDARQGVTDVIRGDDLLSSAARQVLLYRALSLEPPNWWHLPLVVGTDGRRLAKRHGDTRIATYRERGVPSQRIIGLLAYWSGASGVREPMTADEFRTHFSLASLPSEQVTFTQDDHEWLLAGADS